MRVFLLLSALLAIHRVEVLDEDGMRVTREEWITSSLQRREQTDREQDRTMVVYDGTDGWRKDWNGFVEKLAGDDLRRERDVALIHSLAATDSDDVKFTRDAATGLPSRATMPSFDGTLTVDFSDWREVDGRKVPFTETWTTGPNKTVAHLQSIEFVSDDRVDLTPPQPGPEDAVFLRAHATRETLPFNFDNNHIMLLTSVNGAGPIWFLVDTGAPYSIINTPRVAAFGLTPYGGMKTIGGGSSATSGSYVEHVNYRLGEVELRDQHAAVLDLRGLERLYGMPMGGILGFDFLSRFVVDIDYVAKTFTLHPRGFDTSKIKGTRVPLVMQGEQPYLAGSIVVKGETIPTWFILDVGAADTITFTTPFIAKHQLIERAGDAERVARTVTAPQIEAFNPTNIRGLIDEVIVGDVKMPHMLVNLSAAKAGAYTSPRFDGNIGETMLARFAHVFLDYGRSEMILRTQPSTTRPFEERKSFGMTIVTGSPDYHQFTVTAVGKDSAAAAAGLQKGDVITSIDGTPAAQLDLAAVKRLTSAEGTQHDVGVRRGAETLTLHATIALAPLSLLK